MVSGLYNNMIVNIDTNGMYYHQAYIERVLILTGVTIHASNWRRIVLGALILASKGIHTFFNGPISYERAIALKSFFWILSSNVDPY